MANHTIASSEVGVHNVLLTATQVDVFTFAKDPGTIEVLSDGAAAIYVTVDDSTPTVGGTHTYKLPAVPCARRISHKSSSAAVKVISAGAPTISVTRA